MNTDSNRFLMSAVKKAFLQRDISFEDVNDTVLRFPSVVKMYPLLKVTDDGVAFTCPLAYYETEEQHRGLLVLFENARQVWYDEAGWGPFIGECNEPNARFENLPDDLIFEDNPEQRLISAYVFFNPDYILDSPEEFSSTIFTICWYPVATRIQICEVINKSMVKTITEPDDPKSYFYCTMLLYYRITNNNQTSPWLAVDWEDVRTSIKISKQLIFYPSLLADSSDGLIKEMEKTIQKDVPDNEPYGLIVTLTVPKIFFIHHYNDPLSIGNLRNKFGTDLVMTHIYIADDTHPYAAEMVLFKMKNKDEEQFKALGISSAA